MGGDLSEFGAGGHDRCHLDVGKEALIMHWILILMEEKKKILRYGRHGDTSEVAT